MDKNYVPQNPNYDRWQMNPAPHSSDITANMTAHFLQDYFQGVYKTPDALLEAARKYRTEEVPLRKYPQPPINWEDDILRNIGWGRTPKGELFKLPEGMLSPQAMQFEVGKLLV